ncbi:hypothetical protein ABPG77_005524 [Micractinium sp. CCAP 211/92]
MTSSLSVCQPAVAHLPPLHKQQLFVEQRGSTVRVHGLASRSCRARQQHQPRCGAPAAAASQPCSKHGSQRPSWRQGFLTPAATTRQEAEQQQEEGLAPLTPSKDANGNFTSAALASLRYTSPDGSWLVRPLNKDDAAEVRRIVALQTEAFHTPAALPALDGMAKKFFEAEVLSEMQKKLRFNPEELFVSLVVEPAPGMQQQAGGSSSGSGGAGSGGAGQPGVVGVVEVSYIATRETLARLEPGTEGFCYVASMVVAPAWRRRGAAQALLAAAELAAGAWEERQTLLYVYQDNEPAIGLYRAAGYEVLHSEKRRFGGLGARPRHLMRKRW